MSGPLITASMLARAGGADPEVNAPLLWEVAQRRAIDTPARVACWLANVLNESEGLTVASEDLYYKSASWMRTVFPSHFPTVASAVPFIANPVALGNKVYAELGPIAGGYAARGLSWGQLTSDAVHGGYAAALGLTLGQARTAMLLPAGVADAAGWYFQHMGCAKFADAGDVLSVRDVWAGLRPHTANPFGLLSVMKWHGQVVSAMSAAAPSGQLHAGMPKPAATRPVATRPAAVPSKAAEAADAGAADALNAAEITSLGGAADA